MHPAFPKKRLVTLCFRVAFCLALVLFGLLNGLPAEAGGGVLEQAHLTAYAAGEGPSFDSSVFRLLDRKGTPGQSNAVAFDLEKEGIYATLVLRSKLRILAGGDGGAFLFLNTAEYGQRGPAPFLKSWVEPNLSKTFAVGIDVHNPPSDEPFGPWGNYQGLPEREVSLHWDGRELVKRLAPAEFRGDFAGCEIIVQHVVGGAAITVSLGGQTVYDRYFIAGMTPYEARLAIGAGTREEVSTEFDVRDLSFEKNGSAPSFRPAHHVELFNHVRTDGKVPSHARQVSLPPANWAYGRVVLTLEIHDTGSKWDPWDRNGYLYLIGPDGQKYDIAPFITSFRRPCHWTIDVTHFRPWLAGEVTFEIAVQRSPDHEQKSFLFSAALDFYPGEKDLDPYRVVPLWHGLAKYRSAENHFRDFFEPQTVQFDQTTQMAQLFIFTSGHSEVGEFTPSPRRLVFLPETDGDPQDVQVFDDVLWKTDVYLNPHRPQSGTWKYSRAGWAPGAPIEPWRIDLTPYLRPGKTALLDYRPAPYDFSDMPLDQRPAADQVNQAVQLVRSYLVLYHRAEHKILPPTLKILEVFEGSNAWRADLRSGDYLQSYNGLQPESIEALHEAIRNAENENQERIQVVLYRGTERIEKLIEPGRMGIKVLEQ